MGRIGRPRKERERRTFTEHRGVKLKRLKRRNGDTWVARWLDPDTRREVQESLTAQGLTTDTARKSWAVDKAAEILARRKEVRDATKAGKPIPPVANRTAVDAAIKGYLEGLSRKAPKTVKLYTLALSHFQAWADKRGIATIQDVSDTQLANLGKYLHGLKAKVSAKGKKGRGVHKESSRLLAPATVNQFIRGIRTFLADCRRDGARQLTSDVIHDCLPFADLEHDAPNFLKAEAVRALIEACERHDAECFTTTRDGKSGPKYAPIKPFVLACLLSGMRFSELASIEWSVVDLKAGAIELAASATKTKHGRRVTLRESPGLWALLERMKLRAGEARYVFGPMRRDVAEAARRRLTAKERTLKGKGRNPHKRKSRVVSFGAPSFTWHDLRRTCGTFLTCAPSIYGAASAFLSAKRLGHSVTVAERHYVNAIDVSSGAKTLEEAMGIADLLPTRATANAQTA